MMNQKKPTVLFLASWYPTPSNKNHGIFIKNHALALSQFINVIVVYAYSSSKKSEASIQKNTLNPNCEEWLLEYEKVTSSLPVISSLKKLHHYRNAYQTLLTALIDEEIAIKAIQLNTIFPAAIVLPLFKKHFKVPYTIVEHWSGYLPEDGNYKGFITKWFTKKAVANASKLFYVSEKQKLAMQQHGLNGNFELLYNVIDTSIFSKEKRSESIKPMLLHVSSLVEKEKNITGTLAVIKLLQDKKLEFDTVFIGGEASLARYFQNLAVQTQIKHIAFIGEKTPAEVASYMQKASALLLFSNYEGMPVVVLEALASGLPVFSSRVGQLPYLWEEAFGKLVEVGDEKQLDYQLEQFLKGKLKFDSDKMAAFATNHASLQQVGKVLFRHYSKLVE